MNHELEFELKDKLLKIEGHEMLGEVDKRQLLIYQAVTLAQYMGLKSGYRPIGGDPSTNPDFPIPQWAGSIVAYIVLPTGEISYFLKKHDTEWSGYPREVKLARIKDFLNNTHHEEEQMNG